MIRRAYFEQHRSIKEIVRTLLVSRATVRKVVRGHQTEFKYERGVQPSPKLGAWVEVLREILEQEARLPKRERRSTQRLFEELRGRGYDGAHDSVHRFVKACRRHGARQDHPDLVATAGAEERGRGCLTTVMLRRCSGWRWPRLQIPLLRSPLLASDPNGPSP